MLLKNTKYKLINHFFIRELKRVNLKVSTINIITRIGQLKRCHQTKQLLNS